MLKMASSREASTMTVDPVFGRMLRYYFGTPAHVDNKGKFHLDVRSVPPTLFSSLKSNNHYYDYREGNTIKLPLYRPVDERAFQQRAVKLIRVYQRIYNYFMGANEHTIIRHSATFEDEQRAYGSMKMDTGIYANLWFGFDQTNSLKGNPKEHHHLAHTLIHEASHYLVRTADNMYFAREHVTKVFEFDHEEQNKCEIGGFAGKDCPIDVDDECDDFETALEKNCATIEGVKKCPVTCSRVYIPKQKLASWSKENQYCWDLDLILSEESGPPGNGWRYANIVEEDFADSEEASWLYMSDNADSFASFAIPHRDVKGYNDDLKKAVNTVGSSKVQKQMANMQKFRKEAMRKFPVRVTND